jgi:hypothetical protein
VLGLARAGLHPAVFALGEFAIGQQAEALFEAEGVDLGDALLFGERFAHAAQAQLLRLLQVGVVQHG